MTTSRTGPPSDCPPPLNEECPLDISAWDASASKALQFSGSVHFPDPCNLYGCLDKVASGDAVILGGKRLTLNMQTLTFVNDFTSAGLSSRDCSVDVGDDPDYSCYGTLAAGNIYQDDTIWLEGFTASGTIDYQQDGADTKLNVVSLYNAMDKTHVTSHHMYSMFLDPDVLQVGDSPLVGDFGAPSPYTANTVMNDLASIYGGLNSADYDFSDVPSVPIQGPVNGTSLLQQMRLVAAAAGCDLYINERGKLVAEKWKKPWLDEAQGNNPVELVIPRESVVAAELSGGLTAPATRIKVSGRYKSGHWKGYRNVTQFGSDADGSNAPDDFVCGRAFWTRDGSELDPFQPGEFCYDTGNIIQSGGLALKRNPNEFNTWYNTPSFGTGYYPNSLARNQMNSFLAPLENFRKSMLLSINQAYAQGASQFSTRGFNVPPPVHAMPLTYSNSIVPVEDTQNQNSDRMEFYLITCDVDSFGYIDLVVDNPYVYSHEQAMDLAIRVSHEQLMGMRTWELRLKYNPCLKINQVVEFTTPGVQNKEDQQCDSCTVRGIVTSIRTSYRAGPNATADHVVTVSEYDLIGGCDYCGCQLLHDPCLAGLGRFLLAETGTGTDGEEPKIQVLNGAACAEIPDGGSAKLKLMQPFVSAGPDGAQTYCLCVDVDGGVDVDLNSLGGGGAFASGISSGCGLTGQAGNFCGSCGGNSYNFTVSGAPWSWTAIEFEFDGDADSSFCISDISLRVCKPNN